MLQIQISGAGQTLKVITGLTERLDDLSPALKEIGEDMVESTKRRFATATAPDGTPWKPNSPVTMARYASAVFKSPSHYKKDGTLRAASAQKLAGKKPLTGETRALQTTINYQVDGSAVRIGSPMIYAGVQQYGAKTGEFGMGAFKTRKGTFPIPWGDIPARPFLGFSDTDQAAILDTMLAYLKPG